LLLIASLCTLALHAQLSQIDPAKLPQDQSVQKAYATAQVLEPMVRSWNPNWTYETPKTQVVAQLASSLRELQFAQDPTRPNEELLLLTGLVAHFGYNLDVEKSYEVAVRSFEEAARIAPSDFRAEWFLGMHRCQSNDTEAGMQELLALEAREPWQQLPVGFWDDYIFCSAVAVMPAHTLRAVDHAVHLGEQASSYTSMVDIAHSRYQPTGAKAKYSAQEVWRTNETGDEVEFTSDLCGIGFSARSDWHMRVQDVSEGTCMETIETGPYPSRSGTSTPTILIITRVGKPGETLDNFVHSALQAYPSAQATATSSCPAPKCAAFEIVTNSMYQSEGGGHLLAAGFAGESPEYPGLLFERPNGPPKNRTSGAAVYYRPDKRLQRLAGTLYTLLLLDSNEAIFQKAKADFEYLLKSIELD
jgi:hypothetical protein